MKNEDGLELAIKNFYIALNNLFKGNPVAMKNTWSHEDDVSHMESDGLYLIG